MNIEKEIKADLFAKLKEYLICNMKMDKMEKSTGLNFDKAFDELIDTNGEYRELSDRSSFLRFDIDRLLIHAKGYPLTITNEQQMKLLDIAADHLQGNISEKALCKHIETQLLIQETNIVRRLRGVKALFLRTYLHKRIYSLYNEAINCYIQGMLNATCVLCRTISELIAKQYIRHRGCENLLCGKEKEKKRYTIPGILSELSVPKNILQTYRKIHSKADSVLHDISKETTEEETLVIIKLLRDFMTDFPKCM